LAWLNNLQPVHKYASGMLCLRSALNTTPLLLVHVPFLQDYLRSQHRTANVKVDAYLFAPPNAGDATWAAGFNQMVNARR
jgi:hypothetical protein